MFAAWGLRRRFARALELERTGRHAEARDAFRAVAEKASGRLRADALSRAGACATWLGEFAAARKLFEAAKEADPDNADHWLNYANACHRLGDGLGADEAYVEALKRAPGRPDILYYQSVYYADKLTRGGFEGARRAFRSLVDSLERPGGPQGMAALSFPFELPLAFIRNLALEKQLVEDGLTALTEFVDRPSTHEATFWVRPSALNHRGLLLANAGRYDEAVRDYAASLELRPSDDVTFNLAMTEIRRHRWDEARRALTAYSRRHPTSAVTTYGLALLAETRGEAKEAARLYAFFLDRHAKASTPIADLLTLDVARSWVSRARQFLEAMSRPVEGGYFEVPPEGTKGDISDRPRGS
jgi:tetratricopeptide (TPR) repeat protein